MELKDLYREIVNDHNINPVHKYELKDPDLVLPQHNVLSELISTKSANFVDFTTL